MPNNICAGKDNPPRGIFSLFSNFFSHHAVCLSSWEEIFPQYLILCYKQSYQASETSIFCKEVLDDCAVRTKRFKYSAMQR